MKRPDGPFDPRVWLLWWVAASFPALTGRNPFLLTLTLLIIVLVRTAVPLTSELVSRGVLKLFVVFALVGVLFNLLTVHSGDIVLWTLPNRLPVAGGALTLNAVFYGLLGAVAILTLVLAGLTVAEQIDWPSAMRLLPEALLGFGAAASIAVTFFPQMIGAFRDIREARMMRGAPLRTPADFAGIVSPMVAAGLDRAVTLSELLEVRAFGSSAPGRRSSWRNLSFAGAVALLAIAAFAFTSGSTATAAILALIAVLLVGLLWSTGRGVERSRTRYRTPTWNARDSWVCAGAILAIIGMIWSLFADSSAIGYEPYPNLTWPDVQLPLLVSLCGLAAPALLTLAEGSDHD